MGQTRAQWTRYPAGPAPRAGVTGAEAAPRLPERHAMMCGDCRACSRLTWPRSDSGSREHPVGNTQASKRLAPPAD